MIKEQQRRFTERMIVMTRTKLCDRQLPDYTVGEEIFNAASHGAGALLGIAALIVCVIYSAANSDAWSVISSCIYGGSLIALYSMSSIYHGLRPSLAKKVMQVIDHCTIYFLISGTYTPILLCGIRTVNPALAWALFGIVWGVSAIAIVLTAIDLKKFKIFSMICYLGLGWCIVFAAKPAYEAIGRGGSAYLLLGGVCYTIGAILYGLGKKHRYMHSVFHLFVLSGSILHFFSIFIYVL